MSLDCLSINQSCVVRGINCDGLLRRRLMDMGFVPGSVVSCVLSSPSGNPMAYFIKNTVIALRKGDACSIEVDII